MTKGQKVRALRRAINRLSHEMNEDYKMSCLMDGSGECGGIISEYFNEATSEIQKKLFRQVDLSREEYIEELKIYTPNEKKGFINYMYGDLPRSYEDIIEVERFMYED